MKKRETEPSAQAFDPLGMVALKEIVSLMMRERDEARLPEGASPMVDRLDAAFGRTAELYEMLKDRYLLLKRHTAQLEDELGWLRDQVDDLASLRESAPVQPKPGRPRRRYEDRGRR